MPEDPNKFDPTTHMKKHYKNYSNVVERRQSCNTCQRIYTSYKKGKYYQCKRTKKCRDRLEEHKISTINVISGDIYRGWYENLDTTPVWIESKAHLYRECIKRGVQARALMSGGEMKRPRGA